MSISIMGSRPLDCGALALKLLKQGAAVTSAPGFRASSMNRPPTIGELFIGTPFPRSRGVPPGINAGSVDENSWLYFCLTALTSGTLSLKIARGMPSLDVHGEPARMASL